jgi:hypothetical protein
MNGNALCQDAFGTSPGDCWDLCAGPHPCLNLVVLARGELDNLQGLLTPGRHSTDLATWGCAMRCKLIFKPEPRVRECAQPFHSPTRKSLLVLERVTSTFSPPSA